MGRNSEGLPTSHDDGCGRRVPSPWGLAVLAGILAWLPIHADLAGAAVHLAAPEVRATGEASAPQSPRDSLSVQLTLEGWVCPGDVTAETASRVSKWNGATRYLEMATRALTAAARAQEPMQPWSVWDVLRVVRPVLQGSEYNLESELSELGSDWLAEGVLQAAAQSPFHVVGAYHYGRPPDALFEKRSVDPPIEQAEPDGPRLTYALQNCYMRDQLTALATTQVEAVKRMREAAERYKQTKAAVLAGRQP